ncbi:MAG: DUF2269 family protein [Chloroflexi bacterium]|nr:MAG: DUF2269 family protein [Chloroflexota bacterium]
MTIDWIHLVHVVAAMVWVGGGVVLMLVGRRAQSSPDPKAIGEFARTLRYVGLRALMPAVILVLVSGVWMVAANAAWKFTQVWVLLALGLFGIAFLIGAVYLSGVGIQLARAAEASDAGHGALVRLISRWLVGYGLVLVTLLVAAWDMVFKPGL